MIILFGATGDLTKRKLLPALKKLYDRRVLRWPIICIGRRNWTRNQYLKFVGVKGSFTKMIHYFKVDLSSGDASKLKEFIKQEQKNHRTGGRVFYLAIPPGLFKPVIELIKDYHLRGNGWSRVVFEKPFGHDLRSARELNRYVTTIFDERDIYRIDHFLGKELVQNILTFRFANSIFEETWNNKFVDNIQIVMDEKSLIGTRGGYYDKAGAIRDMIQNHALQLLSLTAMEPPKSIDTKEVIKKKVNVLKQLKLVRKGDMVVGQYNGYASEKMVGSKSRTETFAAIKVRINNKRWKGVPFYIRTGKGLASNKMEVNIILKDVSCNLFNDYKCGAPNVISLKIKPVEGISIKFNAKAPGHGNELIQADMDFCHKSLHTGNTPESYELLLHDVVMGNKSLFTSWDEVFYSWKFIDDLLTKKGKLYKYKKGSNGPLRADKLLGGEWVEDS